MSRPLVYIAAPLFSDSEKSTNEFMSSVLERHCDTFLPQRDGYLVPKLIARGQTAEEAYSLVFRKDIDAIRRADALIINLDGRTIDEGAAFELGVAYAAGKICMGYRTDVRVLLPWGLNPMIAAPLIRILKNPGELETWAIELAVSGAQDRDKA
jgi:nucleoside 2-deoxyribosyltransferase